MKRIPSLLVFSVLLAGCDLSSMRQNFDKDEGKEVLSKAKFDRVLIDSTGEMQVYASMNRVTTLSKDKDATLQFSDPFKELYLLVIRESVSGFADAVKEYHDQYVPYVKDSSSLLAIYGDFTTTRTTRSMDLGTDTLMSKKTIHGMSYRAYAVTGSYNKIPLFYYKGVYQGKNDLYQVVVWTLGGRRNLYEGVMQKMVESLQEESMSSQ